MKPRPFEYHAPGSLSEALALLDEHQDDVKVLAGGQSLIPLMNMRISGPGRLVDINGIDELDFVAVGAEGVRVGAGVRQADLEAHAEAIAACPVLRQALKLVAHQVIRNRGTVCGSIAHADPAAELPAVLLALDGCVEVASAAGKRVVPASDFFLGPLETSLRPDELVTSVLFPAAGGARILEVSRRHGDFAVCGVVVTVAPGSARAACFGVGPTPLLIEVPEPGALAAAVVARVEPVRDVHASAEYRRHLAGALTERALEQADG